jgi:hypothetical protein
LRHAKAQNEQFVIAINQIPIVWHENNPIIESLNKFISTHKEKANNENEVSDRDKRLNNILNDLVIKIANDLNYTNIDNDLMHNPYNPAASSNRYSADSVRDELFWHENFPRLEDFRNSSMKSIKQ